MGSWWHVKVGRHVVPVFGKNYVSDELMLVFTDADRYLDQRKHAEYEAFVSRSEEDAEPAFDDRPRSWHEDLIGYAATVGTLRARLDLQGFSGEWVRFLATALIGDRLFSEPEDEVDAELRRSVPDGYPDAAAVTARLVTRRGLTAGSGPGLGAKDPDFDFLHQQWIELLEGFDDPRFALALALTNSRSDTVVRMDLTDLFLGGYLDIDDVPHRDARARLATSVAAGGPVIVIAEGASDARWLRASLEVVVPEVAHLFEFLDFAEFRAPGGTDRVVSLTKGMAAAGVMNRIVAVLDNDTAGRIAAQQLQDLGLPARIAVVTLPAVDYAIDYPTLGPDGPGRTNVNGRAASIEFMFGNELLRDDDRSLFPVRWMSWMAPASDYQGALDKQHKAMVGARLDQLLATAGPRGLPNQVREGCDRLASLLLTAASPAPHVPATNLSDLTTGWRRDALGYPTSC